MNIGCMLRCSAIAGAVLFGAAWAQTFEMAGGDAGTVSVGDTLVTADDQDVSIAIESGSRLLVKSGSLVVLGGGGGALEVTLDDGQVFLDRNKPHALASVRILTKGYSFTPEGTAAAVKTTRQGAPTVAVLRGSVQMQSAQGESASIGARQFGTVNSAGRMVSGDLNERGLAQLEAWSGVKAEPAQTAQTAQAEHAAQSEDNGAGRAQAAHQAADTGPAAPPAPSSAVPASEAAPEAAQEAAPQNAAGDGEAPAQEADAKKADRSEPTPLFSRPDFELSAGLATVDGQPWTRIALGVDVPVWRFGVFLDLELFVDPDGQLSNKGWDFSKGNAATSIYRKIRYIRYGHEEDPLFVKFGGLEEVTLGYGIIMDRFTNMLNYPDEKLLGLQFYLNDISSAGITLQTLISDFAEVKDGGGIYAARLAFRPLKPTGIFLLDRLTLGGTVAYDRNTRAQARKWADSEEDEHYKSIRGDSTFNMDQYLYYTGRSQNEIDRLAELDSIRKSKRSFALYGLDAGLPVIRSKLLNIDIYGQFAARADSVDGWGIGAPGVAVHFGRLSGSVEYRKVEGRFTPGFFDTYYLDERFPRGRYPWEDKSEHLDTVSLNGVFGRAGMDMFGILQVDASAQYMLGPKDARDDNGDRPKDLRYEASGGFGPAILDRVPKFNKAEVYIRHTNIGFSPKYRKNGEVKRGEDGVPETAGMFDRTPFMYWGYRMGFEIMPGASLIWDYRYGWKIENGKLVPNNYMLLETALRF